MIKVVHLQIAGESSGRAALRLHKAFLERGLDSSMVTLQPSKGDDKKVLQKNKAAKFVACVDSKLQVYRNRKNAKELGLFSYPIIGTNVSQMPAVKNADVIYIHWVLFGFMSFANIEQVLKLGKPVYFFMHDMWNITGGCHYSFSCEKFKAECNSCPVLASEKRKDLSTKGFYKKQRLYAKYPNVKFIAPSKWLFHAAQESALTKNKPVFYIPNVLDRASFKTVDKSVTRRILNIRGDDIVIAFGAVSVNSPYKGWKYLKEALHLLFENNFEKDLTVLIFGNGDQEQIQADIPYKTKFTGHLSDEFSMLLVYNTADVFVAPSLADNLPTTILESLACGTSVVGFDVGGIPDMIEHRGNGYLANYKDAVDLAKGIQFCIENKVKGSSLPQFDIEYILDKHFELFKDQFPESFEKRRKRIFSDSF